MLVQCVSIVAMPQGASPSPQGAHSSDTDSGCWPAPCAYDRGSHLWFPCQKCPHLVYCSAVDILKFLMTSSLDLCSVNEEGWDMETRQVAACASWVRPSSSLRHFRTLEGWSFLGRGSRLAAATVAPPWDSVDSSLFFLCYTVIK